MFILYAILIGLVLGLLFRGHIRGLAEIKFRWAWLVVVALLIQVVLFSEAVADNIDATLGIAIYVGSTAMALVAVAANLRIPGVPLVALGAISNLAAILANGGYMPADPGAMAALGRDLGDDYSNSTVVANPVLGPLTDIFAMPGWLPFANVFSIGDVLIGAGVVVAMVVAMRKAALEDRAVHVASGWTRTGILAGGDSLLAQAWDRWIAPRSAALRSRSARAATQVSVTVPPSTTATAATAATASGAGNDTLPAALRALAGPVGVPVGLVDGLLVPPGSRAPLRRLDHGATFGMSEPALLAARADQDRRLAELRETLRIAGRGGLLVVVQGVDRAGMGGAVRRLVDGLGADGCSVRAFGPPTADELGHDFLWRYHAAVPRRGAVAVFKRSHYEDVTTARLAGQVPEPVWRARYGQIRDWERMLVAEGTTVVKLFLSIDRAEYGARLQALVDDPAKRWRITTAGIDAYERWDAHRDAYEEAIAATSTDWAPWFIVPSTRKRFRDLAVAEIVIAALERELGAIARPAPASTATPALLATVVAAEADVADGADTAGATDDADSVDSANAANAADAADAADSADAPEPVAAPDGDNAPDLEDAPATTDRVAAAVARHHLGWPADDPRLPAPAAQVGT